MNRALSGKGSLDGPQQLLPALYALPASDFHDITSGNNGYAAKAGYDPYGAARFLTSLGREGDLRQAAQANIDPRAPDFLSSHPATPERVTWPGTKG